MNSREAWIYDVTPAKAEEQWLLFCLFTHARELWIMPRTGNDVASRYILSPLCAALCTTAGKLESILYSNVVPRVSRFTLKGIYIYIVFFPHRLKSFQARDHWISCRTERNGRTCLRFYAGFIVLHYFYVTRALTYIILYLNVVFMFRVNIRIYIFLR